MISHAARVLSALFVCLFVGSTAFGQPAASQPATCQWHVWGGTPTRNAVSREGNIPSEWDIKKGTNIKWKATLGSLTYGTPVIADGRIFIGTNNGSELRSGISGDKGVYLCLDEKTGELLWQATHDKLPSGPANDWPEQGVVSNAAVCGERVYYVSNRCELVCADVRGFRDGENDGPFTDEQYTEQQDADFVWVLDMMGELGVYPHNLASCCPVAAGDLVFVCTGNAVDDEHGTPPKPDAPSFIAVNKDTGKVVWARNDPGKNILHGQWSSPAYGEIDGVAQVVFAGGDGWCYSFESLTGRPLWKFDLNPEGSEWEVGGTGTKTSIVATPVIAGDRVYLAAGDDPESADGPGHLYAIDATKRGDITKTGKIWHYGDDDFGRTIASVAVADGLVYAADLNGFLNCLDEKTGERLWQHDLMTSVWGSPAAVGDKVMIGTTDGELLVFKHQRAAAEPIVNDMRHSIYSTPAVADGTLYVATAKYLYAVAAPASTPRELAGWPMFRGNVELTGVARDALPEKLALRWQHEVKGAIVSAAAIVDGVVYIGSDEGELLALDLKTGDVKWQIKLADKTAIESSPTVVDGLVILGDEEGVLHAFDAASGTERWKLSTEAQIISSAVPVGENVLVGSYDGNLYCVHIADGKLIWKYETEDRVHATPAIAGQYALFGGCDAHLHVVDVRDGKPLHKIELNSVTGSSAAVRGPLAFLGTYGQEVLGIDWQNAKVVWRFEDKEHSQSFLSSAALAGDLVLIGGRDKRLRALDVKTGKQQWEFVTKNRVDSSPVVVGQRVFFGSEDGNLYELELATGRQRWRFEAGAEITGSPAVAEGYLVIGALDGMIYCFGAQPPAQPQ